MPKLEKPDYYSKAGAALLVDCIMTYWRNRGYSGIVATRYKLDGFDLYGVRSNIVNGYPPRRMRRLV